MCGGEEKQDNIVLKKNRQKEHKVVDIKMEKEGHLGISVSQVSKS